MSRKTIDCEQALRQVFDYIDHELQTHDHEAMRAHLDTCRSCFSRVEFERLLKDKLNTLGEDQPTQTLSDRVRSLLKTL